MLRVVAETLRHRGTQGWLVGGTVRDRELGRFAPDLDVVVADDPGQVAAEVAARLRRPWFPLSKHFQAYRVLGDEGHVDVASLRGGGLIADLGFRDFTVNAMAIPVEGGHVVDPFGGMAHLQERLLAAVSHRVFEDDPLRLMRAARFCHVLDFRLDPRLEALLHGQVDALVRTAPERVLTEMVLTLGAGSAAAAVGLWRELGLLRVVLPELPDSSVESASATLEELDRILADLQGWFPGRSASLEARLARPADGALPRPVALRLAGLLRLVTPERCESVGRRLRLPTSVAVLARKAADQRVRVWPSGPAASLPERAVVSFLWEAAPWEPETIILGLAAGVADDGDFVGEGRALAQRLMERWACRSEGMPRPPIGGDDLMRELGLQPGPLLGRVAKEVQLAWEAGEVKDARDALEAGRRVLLTAGRA
ncbi:MAG TPA: hypothetical protein VIL51_06295 [Thermoleophilia bacterium]